jgi:hypothetical protein
MIGTVLLRRDAAADLQPVHLGHQDVQDDQIGAVALETTQARGAIASLEHRETLVAQRRRQHRPQGLVVVHDQHPANHLNRVTLAAG